MILTLLVLGSTLILFLVLITDLLGEWVQRPSWVSSMWAGGWWVAILGPRAWVATLPLEVAPAVRLWVLRLIRLWLACAIVSLLSKAALGWSRLPRWAEVLTSVALTVEGLCFVGFVLLLFLSGVRAGLHWTRHQ